MVCLGNREHPVIFEIAPKYCISDSFTENKDYSLSSKRFLSTVVDIMVIWIKFAHSCPLQSRNCQSRNSRDTLSNQKVWPWSTKWSRAKNNRVLWREYTGNSKHPFSFNNIRNDSTLGHHQMVNTEIKLIALFAAKEALYSPQKQDW